MTLTVGLAFGLGIPMLGMVSANALLSRWYRARLGTSIGTNRHVQKLPTDATRRDKGTLQNGDNRITGSYYIDLFRDLGGIAADLHLSR